MTIETELPAYLPYPRFLLETDLTLTARLVYALLLDRTTLSRKNGWVDEAGRVYVIYAQNHLSDAVGRGLTAVKGAMNELEAAGLIERRRRGFSMPSRLFVKLPPLSRKTDCVMVGKPTVIEPENRPSFGRKTDPETVGKPTPNNLSNNNLRDNDLSGAKNAPVCYGRYHNVLLTEAELSSLQAELPVQWQHYVERLSEYMASTGKRYRGHMATIFRWAAMDAQKGTSKNRIPDYTCEEGESL